MCFFGHSSKTKEKVGDNHERCTEEVVDHYAVTDANRQSLLGSFTPKSGSGDDVGQGLLDFVEGKDGLDIDDVDVLGGDSCYGNTGKFGGVFSYVEYTTKRAFNWFVCLLHLLELLLGHMVRLYVGPTLTTITDR